MSYNTGKIKVCLSHRMPEDHGCSFLQRGPGQGTSLSSNKANAPTSKVAGKRGKQPPVDPQNTLRGTSDRRRDRATADWACSACTSVNSFSVSICEVCQTSRVPVHSEYTEDTGGTGNTGDFSACPFCSARYSDPVDLIAHVEQRHSAESAVAGRGPSRTPSKNSARKCICS